MDLREKAHPQEESNSMKITETETLYSKEGAPLRACIQPAHWNYDGDMMPVGSFRFVHAYCDGGRRYAHDVTPDTAGWVAAATLALHAMTEAIHKANQHTIASGTPWTKNSKPLLRRRTPFLRRPESGAGADGRPRRHTTLRKAGIDAVRQWANQPKDTK